MKRRQLLRGAGVCLAGASGLNVHGATPGSAGVLFASIGAKMANVALHLGFGFCPKGERLKSQALSWRNQSVLGWRPGVEMPAAHMPKVDGLRLSVLHEFLAPGEYEVFRLLTAPWRYPGEVEYEKHELRATFEIQPGRPTYAGELICWLTNGVELPFGLVAPREFEVTLRDETERDSLVLTGAGVALGDRPPLRVSWLNDETPSQLRRA